MKRYTAYFVFEFKRCFRRIVYMLVGILVLCAICICCVHGLRQLKGSDNEAASGYSVVFVMPKDAGIYYTLALNMVSNMDSFSDLCTVKTTTSEDEAMKLLSDGSVSAAVIIPDGMIHTLVTGTNDLPARIIYPGSPSVETVVFRQVVDDLSSMVASSQLGIDTLYRILERRGADSASQESLNAALNEKYIKTVLDRQDLFNVQSSSDSSSISALSKTIGGAAALLFMLFGINLCFFFQTPSCVTPALSRNGFSFYICLAVDYLISVLCEFVIFSAVLFAIFILTQLGLIGLSLKPGLIPALTLACSLFCAGLHCLLFTFFKSRQESIIACFLVSALLMYFSGYLLPPAFLPDALRLASGLLPGSWLAQLISLTCFGSFSLALFIQLSLLGIALAACCAFPHIITGLHRLNSSARHRKIA